MTREARNLINYAQHFEEKQDIYPLCEDDFVQLRTADFEFLFFFDSEMYKQ